MAHTHVARRCSHCDINWPHYENYKKCPLCKQDTWVENNAADVLSGTDAANLVTTETAKKHAELAAAAARLPNRTEFEEFYVERAVAELLAGIAKWESGAVLE